MALKSCLRDRKTAVLVWKCLHDSAPRYLVDLCVPAASTDGRRQSRSAVSGLCLLVTWTRTSTGQRSLAVYGSRTWNRLPTALRSPELSLASFKRQLKTHLSVRALDTAGCSCECRVPSSHRRCCDCTASSAPTTNVQTRLDSTRLDITTVNCDNCYRHSSCYLNVYRRGLNYLTLQEIIGR